MGLRQYATLDAIDPPRGLRAATAILDVLFRHRRLLQEDGGADATAWTEAEGGPHLGRLLDAITGDLPVHLILPAFPAKSPNRLKTLGVAPDLGERIGLRRLQQICDEIAAVYSPGARCTICSDGHVFSDLVGVPDPDVDAYRDGILQLLQELSAASLATFSLTEAFGAADYDTLREELLIGFAEPQSQLRQRVCDEPEARTQFNGIHRFLFEDALPGAAADQSRSQIRARTKDLAYRVVQRSNAWSRLLDERFPEALRLSIHPQKRVSPKIGVSLVATDDPWGTPWHGVMLADAHGYRLVRREHAEALDAALVYRKGRPSHFALPEAPTCSI